MVGLLFEICIVDASIFTIRTRGVGSTDVGGCGCECVIIFSLLPVSLSGDGE